MPTTRRSTGRLNTSTVKKCSLENEKETTDEFLSSSLSMKTKKQKLEPTDATMTTSTDIPSLKPNSVTRNETTKSEEQELLEILIDEEKQETDQVTSPPQEQDEDLIAALDDAITSRYGEVVWAQQRGWNFWPGYIYNPLNLKENLRTLAMKNLPTKYVVYFYGSNTFAAIPTRSITPWAEEKPEFRSGTIKRGKKKKSMTKSMFSKLTEAILIAEKELALEVEYRVQWNHPDSDEEITNIEDNNTESGEASVETVAETKTEEIKSVVKKESNHKVKAATEVKVTHVEEKQIPIVEPRRSPRSSTIVIPPSEINRTAVVVVDKIIAEISNRKEQSNTSLPNIEESAKKEDAITKASSNKVIRRSSRKRNKVIETPSATVDAEKKKCSRKTKNEKQKLVVVQEERKIGQSNEDVAVLETNEDDAVLKARRRDDSSQSKKKSSRNKVAGKKKMSSINEESKTPDEAISMEKKLIEFASQLSQSSTPADRILKLMKKAFKLKVSIELLKISRLPHAVNELRKSQNEQIAKMASALRKYLMRQAGIVSTSRKSLNSDSISANTVKNTEETPVSVPSDSTMNKMNHHSTKGLPSVSSPALLKDEKPKPAGPTDPYRHAVIKLLKHALISHVTQPDVIFEHTLCIEKALFDRFGEPNKEYQSHARAVTFSLRNNSSMLQKYLSGKISPFSLAYFNRDAKSF